MSLARLLLFTGSLALAAFVAGCGQHPDEHADHDHAEHGDHAESAEDGASFKEGRGLQFPPEVVAALGVRTVAAQERSLARTLPLTAQVFSTGPSPRALALVSSVQAESLKPGLKTTDGAELVAISRTAEKATGQIELIFVLPSALPASALGNTIPLRLMLAADSPALTVPRSALLDTATGTFVYVVNGSAYLRTPVKTGASDAAVIEITDGLHAGDTVVATPVNQLWLSELRLTKGGGHSH